MPVQTQRGDEGAALRSLSATRGRVVSTTLRTLIPRKDPAPSVQKARWASGSVSMGTKILFKNRDSIPTPSIPYEISTPAAINFHCSGSHKYNNNTSIFMFTDGKFLDAGFKCVIHYISESSFRYSTG
jgi:hypothetical protein